MKTLDDLTGATGLPVDLHLVLDVEIPVNGGLQAQGDLLVVPLEELAGTVAVRDGAAWRDVPADGVELLRGGTGGNAHTLVADPDTCAWTTDVDDDAGLAIGVFDALAPVYLLHREHGGTGVAPGCFVVRRQREQAPPAAADGHREVPRGLQGHREVPRGLQAHREQRVRFVAD